MASGHEKAASQAGHMAAPTSNANAQVTLAKGEPSTQGAKRKVRFRPWRYEKRTFSEERARVSRLNQTQLNLATNRAACFRPCWLNTQLWLTL
jgi:hypothetical protein